ncbi:uncharacterized protein LOC111679764 isoform X1 [Lucilia cuprina]|uniref:uncharacterized protein LOC111679764 isoform X1 n=1 Tax=Lucilia cuprina TaxID=7375 RepID=UPI001F061548|nr:uncharacterized protein LOC111679764 isoform X1 [Lucilia cuprina]XP_046803362.1 uncharacterized protein LOC111679764 isoform X1 [Lucilia cuprina]XP_046803363.1 uncharacterized protein LOC111679764 isoform X1 [Lucilia cuprina]
MTDAQYEAKYQEMQKYVPFIQRVIDRLKVNNEQQPDKPRQAQLQKMEMLHDLLTNKAKKIRIETLIKCEGVLIKLHNKIEKQSTLLQNEDNVLNNVKLKNKTPQPSSTATSSNSNNKNTKVLTTEEDICGPASPPPEIIADVIEQPVEIPTERRCSPILLKEPVKSINDKTLSHKTEDTKHSTSEQFQNLRQKVFSSDNKQQNKPSAGPQPTHQHHHNHHNRTHHDNRSSHSQHHTHHQTKHLNISRQNSPFSKDNKTSATGNAAKLQTVKVVITEPLPAHVKQQHFPSSKPFLPRASICHNNLRTLAQVLPTDDDNNEAYSPEECWEQYNESHNKRSSGYAASSVPVFSRLGAKVTDEVKLESPSGSKPPGRYTPIPDVLKSPPLSVNDINNLLIESGADKIAKDISEIGTRRTTKVEDLSPNNSFEFVRKKLQQTARLNSPITGDRDERNMSPLPPERLALKYNPHPRQERLISISSTEGSECSSHSKINDPRLKYKLNSSSSTINSPSPMVSPNVNVLPAINLNDPRLKKQNLLNNTPPLHSSTPIMNYPATTNLSYAGRKDPRISRVTANSNHNLTPNRSASLNQTQYSSEENWDSDEETKAKPLTKVDPRLAKREQTPVQKPYEREERSFNSKPPPNRRNSLSQSRYQMEAKSFERANSQPRFQADDGGRNHRAKSQTRFVPDTTKDKLPIRDQSVSRQDSLEGKQTSVNKDSDKNNKKDKKAKNIQKTWTTHTVPNPPKSDTEEDWDSEPEESKEKPKVSAETNKVIEKQSEPIDKSPVPPVVMTAFHKHNSPSAIVSPVHNIPPLANYNQLPPPMGTYNHPPPAIQTGPLNHTFPAHNANVQNRFSSLLNDKSERIKYFEAKKQKTTQPRTYKEFREAKERALAQETALKKAAEEAEAKKKALELKETEKEKELNANDKQETGNKKLEEMKKDKKPNNNDGAKASAVTKKVVVPTESALDKMYRTQNFNTTFSKGNLSFKIPKKKTEEKTKEESAKSDIAANVSLENEKVVDKEKTNEKHKQEETKDKQQEESKQTANNKKPLVTTPTAKQMETKAKEINKQQEETVTGKQLESKVKEVNNKKAKETKTNQEVDKEKQKTKEVSKEEKDKCNQEIEKDEKTSDTQKTIESAKETTKETTNNENNKKNTRDPRCRPKPAANTKDKAKETEKATEKETETEKQSEKEKPTETAKENFEMLSQIVITSSENEVILKPQHNISALDKFNKLTQELTPKPQRVLRRRNTMVVFDSAPLVDKEKLRKANALLFEDVQEEEKRKRKQAEEERINARRNRNLEEMFKKTDDNCTVSTQNIITGKRRTRATINFNETACAISVFKHVTLKDAATSKVSETTTTTTPAAKNTRSNNKQKASKPQEDHNNTDDSDEDDDEREQAKNKKETKANKNKNTKETKQKQDEASKEAEKTKATNETENKSKAVKKRTQANKKLQPGKNTETPITAAASGSNNETTFKPIAATNEEEHQNCAVSSTSTEEPASCSNAIKETSLKKEADDNEPTSTANKSNNPTPTPEANVHVLNEIVDQILKPNADRDHILGLLGQILSDERLELIKSLIESSHRQTEEAEENKQETNNEKEIKKEKTQANNMQNQQTNEEEEEEEEEEDDPEDLKPLKPKATTVAEEGVRKARGAKKNQKKRSELERLNDDIRDMFICEGVLTATGRRMCTIMGKEVETESSKKSTKENKDNETNQQEMVGKRKEEKLKPPTSNRPLRRSLRGCNTNEDTNDDDDEALSIFSRTTEESLDNTNTSFNTDSTPQRKMPILKPNTPIKIPEEEVQEAPKKTNKNNKRKSVTKSNVRNKKAKTKEESETEDRDTETEVDEEEQEEEEENSLKTKPKNKSAIKNTNLHWHNQSKFTNWCMICEKKIPTNKGSLHYKMHHGENYISRLAPVLLQQFKKGKCNQPIFGVKKTQRQPSWFFRCPFCLNYFNTPLPLWLEHFQNHTVEFRYECCKCHYCSNRRMTVARHVKTCEGGSIVTSMVKLNKPTEINAHVCHLCNFIQLKRINLERHYIEQHHLDKKKVELLGYTVTLFDVANVECVTEDRAIERENEAWKEIEKDEQIIDIEDDEEISERSAAEETKGSENETTTSKKQSPEAEVTKESEKDAKETNTDEDRETVNKPKETAKESEEKLKVKRVLELEKSKDLEKLKQSVADKNSNENQQKLSKETDKEKELVQVETAATNNNTTMLDERNNKETDKSIPTEITKEESKKKEKVLQTQLQPAKTKDSSKKQEISKTKPTENEPATDKTEDNQKEADKEEISNESVLKEPTETEDLTETEKETNNDNFSTNKLNKEEILKPETPIKTLTKEQEKLKKIPTKQEEKTNKVIDFDSSDSEPLINKDLEVVNKTATAQDLQDELLALAAQAADEVNATETTKESHTNLQNELLALAAQAAEEDPTETPKICLEEEEETQNSEASSKESQINLNPKDWEHEISNETKKLPTPQTTMSDLIASSIDLIYKRGDSSKRKSICLEASEAKKLKQNASNAFMPSREENSNSPTIQILAQSIINIEEQANEDGVRQANKPITMAERLSQRFKDLQQPTEVKQTEAKENAFEKLVNETVKDLEQETHTAMPPLIWKKKDVPKPIVYNDITVISDDEDWEDIEITETAPTVSATNTGNIPKSKNKGLFQKFGLLRGNNKNTKKHLTPMGFLPKKKSLKEKIPSNNNGTILNTPPPTTTITTKNQTNTNTSPNFSSTTNTPLTNTTAHIGFKPVINIMDDLLPDSPCNDPIDLVPGLAPLEPLQDLNDISSILDSNLSAVNINAADQHTSIEDALDFVSEQQAHDKQQTKCSSKISINNISHVGYSLQLTGDNPFKFYCLLKNCSFLYSSDLVGLETHFMCEHQHIKWNGYCLMCHEQCFPQENANKEYSITQEIRHMMEKHAHKPLLDLNNDSTQHSTTSSQGSEERPKIKLRRLTGDCLSRSTPDMEVKGNESASVLSSAAPLTMLGALLVAKPKPPTKDMPPQPQMPLTEPLLLNAGPAVAFNNVSKDFLITSVTSSAPNQQTPLQISNVISLNPNTNTEQLQLPKISNVRTLAPKVGSLWTQQIEKERVELVEAAAESLEVSNILANAGNPCTEREVPRNLDDSPVIVAETLPLAQNKTGDFVITQTVSAQYNDQSSAALGFNISIAASTANNNNAPTNETMNSPSSNFTITSRQYKCMGSGCKFVSRVPVAMSDHLRFHERRNFSNKHDYLACGFCFYCATDVEDYMKHADQFHIINKTLNKLAATSAANTATTTAAVNTNKSTQGNITTTASTTTSALNTVSPKPAANKEKDTAISLKEKIQDILNSGGNVVITDKRNAKFIQNQISKHFPEPEEVYLRKLRETIEETVGPTGLADDKLYRCVIKNCQTQLTESNFLTHVMYHISSMGGNPNNYTYKCPHCTAQYHRPAGIKAHIKNHARNRYFCYLCDQTSTNPGQLLKHFSEKHWHTLNMYTKELLKPKISNDALGTVLDSGYYVAYTQDLSDEELRKFGEKLILEWQRKKSGSKTHFKSSEIDLLPLSAIFQREVNCGECKYKTKVRTNMLRHLQMHKQNPDLSNKTDATKAYSVDPVNPVPCLNSSERFFDKMTNLASSSLIPSSSTTAAASATSTAPKPAFKIPYSFLSESKCYTCGCPGCNYHTISVDLFRAHLNALHSNNVTYRCTFCLEEICKRGITIERILNHLRFHGATLFRCEECNYIHYLRYVVERHINEKHASSKVNIVTHERSDEDDAEGNTTMVAFAGKKYKDTLDTNQSTAGTSSPVTRSTNSDNAAPKPIVTYVNSAKTKGKWVCDVCGHRSTTVGQMQTHCQQQHGVKNQYKCAHCTFGSHQLSQILSHIDEKHAGKTREARYMYHRSVNNNEDVADTRPLWQRNDPTRVRHIRGILMEDEEESEEYRKKLQLENNEGEEDDEDQSVDVETQDDEAHNANYISGYEFGCYHCAFKTQIFEDLKNLHYNEVHNQQQELAKPFWFRLLRRLCCPECRNFTGSNSELQQHLLSVHKKSRYFAADVTMAENDDNCQRLLCGYCSFHCANVENLYKHHLRVQHWPQDIRIDNNEQIMDILALGKPEVSYQCTLCADIFSNRVAIVQHACNMHAGEESFSFRELSNTLIYRCSSCCFTSTSEMDLMRHMIDHYGRFKNCNFCGQQQSSFNVYMQHCYAEHKQEIQKFRTIYPFREIRKFLLQILVIFPSGLVLNKRNLLNTKYGKTVIIDELYEEIYKISQQPPIPRLSIARLVARKSIEAQQKQVDYTANATPQDEILEAMQSRPKSVTKRRRTVVLSVEDSVASTSSNTLLKPKISVIENKTPAAIRKRRTTVDHENLMTQPQQIANEFSAPLQLAKISKRRRTVAVDRDTLFSSNLTSNTSNSLLIEKELNNKKRKFSNTPTHSPKHSTEHSYPQNLDVEPFSYYGQTPEQLDLTKIYTKVAIGGIKTPLTIDKFKLLFNIDCQLKLTKCDAVEEDEEEGKKLMAYNGYKHIKKACPASHKIKFN